MTENVPPASIIKDIPLSVYGIDAVLKSAHRYTGRAYFEVGAPDGGIVRVTIRSKRTGDDLDEIAGEFMNDLVDQRLRSLVAAETAPIRDLIMAHALSQTDLIDEATRMNLSGHVATRTSS